MAAGLVAGRSSGSALDPESANGFAGDVPHPRPHDPVPTYRYRPLNQLSTIIKVAYAICMAIVLYLVYGLVRQISLIDRFVEANFEDPSILTEMERIETTQMGAIGTLALVSVISSIVFLRWTYVAAMNAQASTTVELSNSPGWCVGWYFVPIANLWKPFTALKEIWEISDVHRGSAAIVGVWWFLRIATSVAERLHNGLASGTEFGGPNDVLFVNYLAIVVNVMTLGVFVLNGTIVHRLTNMQEEKYRLGMDHGGARECPSCGEPLEATADACPMCGTARPESPSSEWRPTFENVTFENVDFENPNVDLDEVEVLDEEDGPDGFDTERQARDWRPPL